MSDVQSAVLKLKHEKLDRSVWVPNVIALMEAVDRIPENDTDIPAYQANQRLASAILGGGA